MKIRCLRNLFMQFGNPRPQCFTQGNEYEVLYGRTTLTAGTAVRDDLGREHTIGYEWVHHFEVVHTPRFSVGQRVRCVATPLVGMSDMFTVGREYTVREFRPGAGCDGNDQYVITCDRGYPQRCTVGQYADHFEAVDTSTTNEAPSSTGQTAMSITLEEFRTLREGDKVRIIPPLPNNAVPNLWSSEMLRYHDQVVTFSHEHSRYRTAAVPRFYNNLHFHFAYNEIAEIVERANKTVPLYIAGDIVEINRLWGMVTAVDDTGVNLRGGEHFNFDQIRRRMPRIGEKVRMKIQPAWREDLQKLDGTVQVVRAVSQINFGHFHIEGEDSRFPSEAFTEILPSDAKVYPPKWVPQVGDWVRLKRGWSKTDKRYKFDKGKYRFVGMVGKITDTNLYGTEILVDIPNANFAWWRKKNHEFVKAAPHEIPHEGPVLEVSKSFRDFLKKIRNESVVAKLILLSYEHRRQLTSLILTTAEINYITYRKDGTISFLPKGKPHLTNEDGSWKQEGRQTGKPAKILRKVFTPNVLKLLKNPDFEIFNNKYKAEYGIDSYEFKEEDASEIPNVYLGREIFTGPGSGGGLNTSCMRGVPIEYFHIYKHCKHLKIVTLTHKTDGLLYGRALLWSVDINGSPATFMDRVYVAKQDLAEAFLDYAKEKGYWRKVSYNSFEDKQWLVDPSGEEHEGVVMKVETRTNFKYFPYIDTFSYGGDKYLTNEEEDAMYSYSSTGGSRSVLRLIDCLTGDPISADRAVEIGIGPHEGEYTDYENTVQLYSSGQHALRSECYMERRNRRYYHETELERC